MQPSIFLALVHYPVRNRRGEVVATAITNVDLHDLARSGRTYGVHSVFVVTPVTLQRRMVREVVGHWTDGDGAAHVRRADALRRVRPVATLLDAVTAIAAETGRAPVVAVTGAQMREPNVAFAALRERILAPGGLAPQPLLLVFGTGWGMTEEVIDAADLRLPALCRDPRCVDPQGPYNHLSVRAAVAIVLDRLLGERDALPAETKSLSEAR